MAGLDTSHAPLVSGIIPNGKPAGATRTVIVSQLASEGDGGRKFVEVRAEDLFDEYGSGGGLTYVVEAKVGSDVTLTSPTGDTLYLVSDSSAGVTSEDGNCYIEVDQGGGATVQGDTGVVVQTSTGDVFISAPGKIDLEGQIGEATHLVGGGGEPAFENSWHNFAGRSPVGFYKVGDRVWLQGCAQGGSPTTVVFTLPVNYRPANTVDLNIGRVLADGSVVADVANANGFYSFSGASFRITE